MLGDVALDYLLEGRSIVPIQPNSKAPTLVPWKPYQEKRPSVAEVRQWWTESPNANIALITGEVSGITVIDVDGTEGVESAKRIQGQLPPTRIIKTPKGYHLYFNYHPGFHTGAAFLPGIDIRSTGGYVVAPPSVVGGITYHVLRDQPMATIPFPPGEFIRRHKGEPAGTPSAVPTTPTWVSDALAHGASLRTRNATATRLVGYFHHKGIPKDIILEMMAVFADRCSPSMDREELITTIDSVLRYPALVGGTIANWGKDDETNAF